MLPNYELVKIAQYAIQLPKGQDPSYEHWKTCQLPLVHVNKKWRETLIPIVFDEAHIVCKEYEGCTSGKLGEPLRESVTESKGSCSVTEKNWKEYLTTRLVVKISASKDVVQAIEAFIQHVDANRLYLRSVRHLILEIETKGAANDGLWLSFNKCEASKKAAHKLVGMLPYIRALTVRVDSSSSDVAAFVVTFTEVVRKHLEAFDFKANEMMQQLYYSKFLFYTNNVVGKKKGDMVLNPNTSIKSRE
ncbi:hypothetical protein LPJ59_004783 [Coemansia sp. RSA 2399]|nr:hypothetical protein LPJ59_004783 [Coemansia sp. RSA 2399]